METRNAQIPSLTADCAAAPGLAPALLNDRLLADMGMPRDQMRQQFPFLLGTLISR